VAKKKELRLSVNLQKKIETHSHIDHIERHIEIKNATPPVAEL